MIVDSKTDSQKSIDDWKKEIDAMTHEEMARLWRFASSFHPIIRTPELWHYFFSRFKELGGMTPEISKKLGFDA